MKLYRSSNCTVLGTAERGSALVATFPTKACAEHFAELLNDHDALSARVAELEAALAEFCEREYNSEALRDYARRFVDNAPIVGRDKEFAAQVFGDYSRALRVARAALAKGNDHA